MKRLLTMFFASVSVFALTTQAFADGLNGRVFVKSPKGVVFAVPANLSIADAAAELSIAGQNLVSSDVIIDNLDGDGRIVAAAFMNLPHSSGNSVLVLRGVLTSEGDINGDFYTVQRPLDATVTWTTELLRDVVTNTSSLEMSYESAFTFSPSASQERHLENVLVAKSDRRVVYARLIYGFSGEILGCWTNAGVGRAAEYYTGECPIRGAYSWEAQANEKVMTAAGFERGVPYSWTRTGQLQSLLIGSERTRAFNEVYLAYSRPNFMGWGFFYLFPWQIMF